MNDQIKVGELVYKISGEMGNLKTELQKAETQINKLRASMDKSSVAQEQNARGWSKLGTAVKGFIAGFVVDRLISFSKQAIGLAQERLTAETALAQQLRVSRNATDEQIKSLIDQANALEKVGVVDASVTTAMQARLAGFDLSTEAIKKLTPAILDYTVAERGANATAEDAVSRANGLAQALQGNFASLTKVGFVLDKATKETIAHGTEMQRVTAITKVLNSTYEGMNETMGKTFAGTVFRAKDALDDLKTTVGFALMPAVGALAEALIGGAGDMDTQLKSANTLGKGLYRVAQVVLALLASFKSLAAGVKIAWNGIQTTFDAGAILILTAAKKVYSILGKNTDAVDGAIAELGNNIDTNSEDIQNAFADMQAAGDDFNHAMNEALDPKGFKEASAADISALKGVGNQTDQFADSAEDAAKETEGLQEKLLGILDTFKKVKEGLNADMTKAFKDFNDEIGKSFEDTNDTLAQTVLDAQDKIKELKKELSNINSDDANAGEQRSDIKAEIKAQQAILESRKGFEERQAATVKEIRDKLTAAGIDAEKEGLSALTNIKSLEDKIKDERALRDMNDFAREEELQKRRLLMLTDNLIAEITATREKITQQEALEAELTVFLQTHNALRKADVEAFANAAITKYGEMATALKNAISLQQRLNALRAAPASGSKQFAQGGYTGTTGGQVHPGEYVIPANMVNAMSGLIRQLEAVRTGSSTSINAPITVNGGISDRLDASDVGKAIAWELGRM